MFVTGRCRYTDQGFVLKNVGGTCFCIMLNLSVVAACKFYNHVNSNGVSHIQFRREIARALVKVDCLRKRLGAPTGSPSKAVRFDESNHNLESVTQGG